MFNLVSLLNEIAISVTMRRFATWIAQGSSPQGGAEWVYQLAWVYGLRKGHRLSGSNHSSHHPLGQTPVFCSGLRRGHRPHGCSERPHSLAWAMGLGCTSTLDSSLRSEWFTSAAGKQMEAIWCSGIAQGPLGCHLGTIWEIFRSQICEIVWL